VTPGPLPPHERAWRHPSELGAPPHEPTSRLGHLLIGSTAAISLLLVALLAINMTPKRYGDADEARVVSSDGAATSFGLAAGAPSGELTPAEHVLRAMSTIIAAQSSQNDNVSTVAATFMASNDRPAVSDATTIDATTFVATSTALVDATVLDPPDTTGSAATDAADVVIGGGAEPASSEAPILTETSELIMSSTDPAATGDSIDVTTSTSSTSTTTSTSTSTTTSTSSSSTTSTLPPSDSPKQFS
jgi:hypothetical protein